MIHLFEYQNKEAFKNGFQNLEDFLDDIWKKREKSAYYRNDFQQKDKQRFLSFFHKNKEIKSNKYVGVIHFNGEKINLLPKIFYDTDRHYSEHEINVMQHHILWWLSYCRKIKFPAYQTALSSVKSDFFEILIYLFAKYTRKLLSNTIYQQYEEINKELQFIKGQLNTQQYITQNLSTGRWHKLHCSYDAFVFDNQFNRIIKFVSKLLLKHTQHTDNKKYLREILFILDEVSDVPVSASDCMNIKFNPAFGEFETVRDYCQLFLSNSISFNYKNDLQLFAFLLPMEYVFEDFIFGFIDKEIPNINAKAQTSALHLDVEKNFALRPDLFLEIAQQKIIADTKYKIIYQHEQQAKKGISQSDLYQMLAYAIRFNIHQVVLFYPNTLKHEAASPQQITIKDGSIDGRLTYINIHQLPIINKKLFQQNSLPQNTTISTLFAPSTQKLRLVIEESLIPVYLG